MLEWTWKRIEDADWTKQWGYVNAVDDSECLTTSKREALFYAKGAMVVGPIAFGEPPKAPPLSTGGMSRRKRRANTRLARKGKCE